MNVVTQGKYGGMTDKRLRACEYNIIYVVSIVKIV